MIRYAAFAALCVPGALLAQGIEGLPAATYELDPSHASVVFSVNHLGLSAFTAGFDEIEATLVLDPSAPESATLVARVDVGSLDLPAPPSGFYEELMGPAWFDAASHGEMRFESAAVALTGEREAEVAGALTIRGVAVPVTLRAAFNTGFAAGIIEPHPRIGFSGTMEVNRSDFGMSFGVPAEGSTFGVGDRVTIRIEAEFIGPPPG